MITRIRTLTQSLVLQTFHIFCVYSTQSLKMGAQILMDSFPIGLFPTDDTAPCT